MAVTHLSFEIDVYTSIAIKKHTGNNNDYIEYCKSVIWTTEYHYQYDSQTTQSEQLDHIYVERSICIYTHSCL